MFFVLSKVLAFILSPFLWFITSMLLYFFLKNEKWKRRFKLLTIILLLFFTNSFPLGFLMHVWEVPGKKIETMNQYDIGIVLTGMFEYNRDFEVLSVRRGADRIWQTISLYKAKKIRKILISGDSGFVIRTGLHEADQTKKVLIKWGIPEDDIILENKSQNTHENAVNTTKLIKEKYAGKKYLLISSALHMKRAAACFRKEGLKFSVFTTDHYSKKKKVEFTPDSLLPSANSFVIWEAYLKEIIGYAVYSFQGYL
jgi:uncharacterized SAM-binding protein YcdF (DUF218 family)